MIEGQLFIDTFGSHIGKHSERLIVTKGTEKLAQVALLNLKVVIVASRGVSISADAIEICSEHGIPIHFLDGRGEHIASVYASGLIGTVVTRRAQMAAYENEKGLSFALATAEAKIHNQATNLKYWAKTRNETFPTLSDTLKLSAGEVLDMVANLDAIQVKRSNQSIDDFRESLLGTEGSAARRYWNALSAIIPQEYNWPGRLGRGANDPLNSLLNYGYGILYGQIENAILLAGLDPYAGFLHADRPGKPSLVLDLIESFRQVAIDRVVFGLASRHYEIRQTSQGYLERDTRQDFATKVMEHLQSDVRYNGKRYPLSFVIQMQARELASYLRGDSEQYVGFKATY